MLTILLGTTITFLGVFPAKYFAVCSFAITSFSSLVSDKSNKELLRHK